MKKLTTEEFTEKAIHIHGHKYNYDHTNYTTSKIAVKIECPIHGYFLQTPNSHLAGNGCNKCAIEYKASNLRSNIDDYITKASIIHNNKYMYTNLIYKDVHTKGIITCPIHGNFEQQLNSHLRGSGCPECGKTAAGNSRSFFKDKRTILYIIKIKDTYKVGITSKSVEQRYYGDTLYDYDILFQASFFDGSDAFNIEQLIIKNFAAYNYVGMQLFKRTKSHEVFTKNPVLKIQQIIKEYNEQITNRNTK